jgi:hypothetical protein
MGAVVVVVLGSVRTVTRRRADKVRSKWTLALLMELVNYLRADFLDHSN